MSQARFSAQQAPLTKAPFAKAPFAKAPLKIGRASRTLAQLWQAPTFLAGLLAFTVVAVSAPLRQDPAPRELDNDLDRLRTALVKKKDVAALLPLAEDVLRRVEAYPHKAGEAEFLAGMICHRLSETAKGEARAALKQQARAHLAEAAERGVAEIDQPLLDFRLGQLLFEQGELERAIHLLARSVDQQPLDQRPAGYGQLVDAYLKLPRPNLDAALETNQKQLDLLDEPHALARVSLTRAEIQMKKEQRADALKTLERIGSKAPRDVRVPARLLQIRCCEAEGLWNRATAMWLELLPEAEHVPGGRARIVYALGWCFANTDPADVGAAEKWWNEAVAVGGDEGQAASLRLAELHLLGAGADPALAVPHLTRGLQDVPDHDHYANKLFDLASLRAMFEQALQVHREDLPLCQELADFYKRVAAPGVAQQRLAQATEALARTLQTQAEQAARAGEPTAPAFQDQAKAAFVQAGEAFEQAAPSLSGEQHSQALWQSAQCYLPAKEYSKAVAVLERFIETSPPDPQLAQALLHLADGYAHIGQTEKASANYLRCIGIPNTAFAFRARYQLALFQIAQRKLDDAEAMLHQNLALGQSAALRESSADREAHELSLIKLAELQLQRKKYDTARLFLQQAIRDYPQNSRVNQLRDYLGYCYLQLAYDCQTKIQTGQLDAQYRKNRADWLEKAREVYQTLADDLGKQADDSRRRKQSVTAADAALLRRAQLLTADMHLELEEFPEALRRYQLIFRANRKRQEGLLACKGLYRCLSALDREAANRHWSEVQSAVRETLRDLGEMAENDAAFARSSRRQWLADLTSMNTNLTRLATPAPPAPPSAPPSAPRTPTVP